MSTEPEKTTTMQILADELEAAASRGVHFDEEFRRLPTRTELWNDWDRMQYLDALGTASHSRSERSSRDSQDGKGRGSDMEPKACTGRLVENQTKSQHQ